MLDGNLNRRHLSENDKRVVESRNRTSKLSPLIDFAKQEIKRQVEELENKKRRILEELKQISFYEIELSDVEREIEILSEEQRQNNNVNLIKWHFVNKKNSGKFWNKRMTLNERRNELVNKIFDKFELEHDLRDINRELKAIQSAVEASESLKKGLEYNFTEVSTYLILQIKKYILNINTTFVEFGLQKEEQKVIEMLYDFFNIEKVIKILRNKFGLSFKVDSVEKIKIILDLMFYNDLSLEDKKVLLNGYVDFLENKKNEVKNYAEKCKIEFRDKVVKAVNEGKLPKGFLDNLHRLDTVNFDVKVLFSEVYRSHSGLSIDGGVVELYTESLANLEKLRHTIFHELVHEISGFTLSENKVVIVQRDKLGVRISDNTTWLNEAGTEEIALMLSEYFSDEASSYMGSGSYVKQRLELNRMKENGLNVWTLYEAMAENVTNEVEPKNKAEKFKKLVDEINAIYGEYAFTKFGNSFKGEEIFEELRNETKMLVFTVDEFQKVWKKILFNADKKSSVEIYKFELIVGKNEKAYISQECIVLAKPEDVEDTKQKLNVFVSKNRGIKANWLGKTQEQGL
jgi:hypothetical protein